MYKKLFSLILIFNIGLQLQALTNTNVFSDYKNHPCIRPCNRNTIPMTCEYDWKLENYMTLSKECFRCSNDNEDNCLPDHWDASGCITANGIQRDILTINRMIPGPGIQICQDDTIRVRVTNELMNERSTSIHWHGMLQKGTPYMDGIGKITQCPIPSRSSFTYEFTAADTGTHLYHAHSGIQRGDGIFGPIVVREKNDVNSNLYDFDLPEHVIVVNDWFADSAEARYTSFVRFRKTTGDPNAILINGMGSNRNSTNANSQVPKALFHVDSNKRYRFRIINAGVVFCPIQFSIQDHKFSVISSDGQPFIAQNDVEAVVLYAGERYDIVLTTNKKVKNYWITAFGLGNCRTSQVYETAILNYRNANGLRRTDRDSINYNTFRINGKQINNLEEEVTNNIIKYNSIKGRMPDAYYKKIQQKPNKKFFFELGFNPEINDFFNNPKFVLPEDFQIYTPQINNITMLMPNVPILSQWNEIDQKKICNEMNRDQVCNNKFCRCIHIIELDLNDLVEFVIVDATIRLADLNIKHPMHLHGHKFAVVSLNDKPENVTVSLNMVKQLDAQNKIKRNLNNPPAKDTLPLPHGGYAVLRFMAENPGIWLFHCHIDYHSELGMMLVFKVGSSSQFPKLPNNFPKCASDWSIDQSETATKSTFATTATRKNFQQVTSSSFLNSRKPFKGINQNNFVYTPLANTRKPFPPRKNRSYGNYSELYMVNI